MVKVNWEETGDELPKPGIYLADVRTCEERKSKSSGTPMFAVGLFSGGSELCTDYIMLGGKGWKFGREKLRALGIPMTQEEVTPQDLIGRLAYVAIVHEESTYTKRDGTPGKGVNVKVDIEATQPFGGYWPESGEAPPGFIDLGAPF